MHPLFVLFIAADIVVMLAVFLYIRKHVRVNVKVEAGGTPMTLGFETIRALATFANAQDERIGNYMQANWSGAPEQLPSVLATLLDTLEADARTQNLPVERHTLKSIIEASLRKHRVGKGREIREALDKVA